MQINSVPLYGRSIQREMINKTICFLSLFFAVASIVSSCYLQPTKPGGVCDDLQQYLVDRKDWCAEEPSEPLECLWGPVGYIIVHHTVTGACSTGESCAESMRNLQKEHMSEKSWPDVGYHYVIGGDGKAYVGRPCNKMGGHTKNHNRLSIGVGLFGDFQTESPSTDMLALLPKIANCGVEKGYLHPNFLVIGHRDAYCSTCPGDALYEVVKNWPRFPNTLPIPTYTCNAKMTPTTTTEMETTTTPTTGCPTTTTTTTPTTEPTTPASTPESADVVLPVYFYLLLSKKPLPCCSK